MINRELVIVKSKRYCFEKKGMPDRSVKDALGCSFKNKKGLLSFYEDFSDKSSLISQMTVNETREMLESGSVSSGMIPKLQSCVEAIEGGVPRAHIVNGTKPHSILVELLTSSGAGTLIYDDTVEFSKEEMRPLGILASRLSENL